MFVNDILNTQGLEFQRENDRLEDFKNQLSVNTATWGLAIYEKELGIKTDINKDINDRRSVVNSKARGNGKVDATLIKMVADAWSNGDCIVTFDGKINIKFTSVYGTPSNLDDLKRVIDEIKPAHLGILYAFAYLLIKDIEGTMTLQELESTKLNKFAGGVS